MKKMKLFATLAVTAAMVLSLAACGGGSSAAPAASDSGSTGGGAAAAGGEKITLIMSQRDEFLSSLEAGAKKAAGELGVNLVTQDANQDESKQIQYVQAAAADGQKAIIVNPINPSACQSIIDAAGDMKVVFVNRVPDDTSILNENAVYVGSDEHTSGKFQGDFLAKYFKDKGQTDIKYILLRGIEGQTSTTLRSESVLKALADNGINATETYAKSCLYDRTEALNQMGNILADSSKEFDCIICNNDSMALGAIEACTQAGKTIDFPIVGIDATADGRQAIKDGTLAMSVFQDPNGQGGGAVAAALNLINGAPLNEGTAFDVDETGFILWVPFEEVTPDNVADYDNR
jgi:ABC-type sugar transport system substrate-binding protein